MQRRKILLAAPDPSERHQLDATLASLDADIYETLTGDELEQTLRQHGPFDLVVTSSQLPQQSGLQVLARLRQGGVSTPFLVLTASPGRSTRVFVSDGADQVLSSRVVDGKGLVRLAASLLSSTPE